MQNKPIDFSSPSLTSHYLKMIFEETTTVLATGTGFIYEYEDYFYLITNGHNVTRLNPETNERIIDHAGFPTIISTRIFTELEDVPNSLSPNKVKINLYNDNEYTQPKWFVHPEHGYLVDVIAIPIYQKSKLPSHIKVFPLNTLKFDEEFEPMISDDVFVIGFPFNVTGNFEFPIWKRGTIATELMIDIDGLPKLLIDTATRSGMSGSPVIFQRYGMHVHPSGEMGKNVLGMIRGFIGIYSGRIGAEDNFKSQLGIVWKKQVIEEILAGRKTGSIDFQRV